MEHGQSLSFIIDTNDDSVGLGDFFVVIDTLWELKSKVEPTDRGPMELVCADGEPTHEGPMEVVCVDVELVEGGSVDKHMTVEGNGSDSKGKDSNIDTKMEVEALVDLTPYFNGFDMPKIEIPLLNMFWNDEASSSSIPILVAKMESAVTQCSVTLAIVGLQVVLDPDLANIGHGQERLAFSHNNKWAMRKVDSL